MRMRMWIEDTSKRLRDHNDAGAGVRVAGGFEHQLLDGLISQAGRSPRSSRWRMK